LRKFELNLGGTRCSKCAGDRWSVYSFHWRWTWYIHMFNSLSEWIRHSSQKLA